MTRLLPASAAQRGMVLLVAALCTFVVTAAAGTSLWLRTSADAIAVQVFDDAPAQATQLQVAYDGAHGDRVPASAGPEVDAALPGLLRDHLEPPRPVVVSPEMVPAAIPARPGEPSYLSVAALPDAGSHVELVEGRAAEPGTTGTVPARVLRSVRASWGDTPRRPVVVEVVLQEDASRELGLPVGSWVRLGSRSYQGGPQQLPMLRVVGTFRAAEPYPSPLDDLDTLRRPAVSDTPDLNLVRATALAADQETVFSAGWVEPPSVVWTFDPVGAPAASDAPTLVEQARQALLQDWPPAVAADSVGAATGIGGLAEEVVDQRRASDGLVTLTLTALAAGAVTVLLAASLVLAARRRTVTTVVRARGASGPWLVARRGAEALLLVVPGLVLAGAGVRVLSGAPPRPADVVAALGAAAVCAGVVTVAQTVPHGGGPLRAVLSDALQLVAVALATTVAALVLLGGALAPDDPLLLVLPPLLGVAGAVVVVRGLQLLLGWLRRAARRTRPVGPVVALSQAAAVAGRVVVACSALVLAVSSVVLAVAASDTLRRGAELAGWEQVGADVAVEAGGLRPPAVEELAALDGVRRAAGVFTTDSVSLDTRTGVEGVTVVGVDPDDLSAVAAGPLRDLDLSPREDGRLPAVASADLAFDDDRAEMIYAQSRVDVQVVDRLDVVPGVTDGGSFVLVDLAALEAATDRSLELFTTVLLAGAPDRDAVEATARGYDPQAIVSTRAGVTRDRLASPAVDRTVTALAVATGAAALLAAFGIVLTVGLGAPERRRTAAVLSAVGGERRLAAGIGAVALLPILLAAGLAAAGCGLLLTAVAGSGFDVAGLVGVRSHLVVRPEVAHAVALAAALLAAVLLASVAASPRPARTTDRPEPEVR